MFQTQNKGDLIYNLVVHVILLIFYASIGHAIIRHGVQVLCHY